MPPRFMPGDSPARFLGELRVLRDQAAIDHAELATRAHYPVDVLVSAEAGPSLPDLPVLSAYVRACGGVPAEWEDRWRALTGTAGDSALPSRPLGGSAAAKAGARAGATATEDQDPAQVISVLSRVVSASGSASAASAGPATGPGFGGASRASVPGLGDTSGPGLGVAPDTAPQNGHWGSRVPDAPAPQIDLPPSSALRPPIPVPTTPPPVPSSVPSPAPFAAPVHPGASSPGDRGTAAQAAALLASARAARGRGLPTPAAVVLVLVAALIGVVILVAVVVS